VTDLAWTESLGGPRSLGTANDVAVAAIEDPGLLELTLPSGAGPVAHAAIEIACGASLPRENWRTATVGPALAIWCGPRRWRLMLDRAEAPALFERLAHAVGTEHGRLADLTGAAAALRVIGPAAEEVLMKLCPLDLRKVAPGFARGTLLADARALLIHEPAPAPSWLALVPRSYADFVARALVSAARPEPRVRLFEPHAAPPV
jgi:sarcosine oxidase subunit gamma